MRRRILRAFGRAQRPVAWGLLALGGFVAAGTLAQIWKTPDPLSAVLLALSLIWQGWEAVSEVENEIDSEGSAEA